MHYISKKCWWFWDSTQKHVGFKLRIFKIPITTVFFLIQNIHEVTWWFEYWSCVFEYSWSDLMGILNIQKVPSWIILNIHEAKSWVVWIFMKWRHRHFECSKAEVGVNIHEMTSWVFWIFKSWRQTFWIFMRWCHWYFEYEVTLWDYSEADAMGILNIHSGIGVFNIQNYVVFWIFIVMTSLQEYSHDGNSCVFKIPMTWIFTIPMNIRQLLNIQNTDDVSITLPHEYSNYPWGHFMNNHDGTSWVFKRLHEFSK